MPQATTHIGTQPGTQSGTQPGIVVTIHDLPPETELARVFKALDAIKALGAETDILVDAAGIGMSILQALWTRGIGARVLPKHGYDVTDIRSRLANCRSLLQRVEHGLRDSSLVENEGARKDLLFDLEALSARC